MSILGRAQGFAASQLRGTPAGRLLLFGRDLVVNVESWLRAGSLRRRRRGAGVLLYHGVESSLSDRFVEAAHIDADCFRAQIRHLRRHYTIVPLSEILDRLESSAAIPDNWVALTFDDGYRNNLTCARQILRDEGQLPMSVFVITDFIGSRNTISTVLVRMILLCMRGRRVYLPTGTGSVEEWPLDSRRDRIAAFWRLHGFLRNQAPEQQAHLVADLIAQLGAGEAEEIRAQFPSYDWLSWDDVRALHDDGVEIGSHTRSHPSLGSGLDRARLDLEIAGSRDMICQEIGSAPRTFVYPYGSDKDYCASAIEVVRESGYRAALTTIPGTIARGSAPYELRRLSGCTNSIGQFRLAVASGMGGPGPAVGDAPS